MKPFLSFNILQKSCLDCICATATVRLVIKINLGDTLVKKGRCKLWMRPSNVYKDSLKSRFSCSITLKLRHWARWTPRYKVHSNISTWSLSILGNSKPLWHRSSNNGHNSSRIAAHYFLLSDLMLSFLNYSPCQVIFTRLPAHKLLKIKFL